MDIPINPRTSNKTVSSGFVLKTNALTNPIYPQIPSIGDKSKSKNPLSSVIPVIEKINIAYIEKNNNSVAGIIPETKIMR